MTTTPYEDYLESLKKWLWIEDTEGISLIIATAIAVMLPGDPIWTFVVDPPGALKTEICRSLTGPYIYSVDYLTPQSLITGFRAKKGARIDILPDLDGKLLVIKDFTTILNKPEKTRDDLLGQLRSVYDGSFEQAFGSGVKKKSFTAKFGILAAVTPVIEIYHKIHSLLGERFIRVKTRYNRKKAVESALKNSGKEDIMRAEIKQNARLMLDYYGIKAQTFTGDLSDTDKEKIGNLGDAIAILRSPVARDARRNLIYAPEAEVGTRLSKQFLRVGQSLLSFNQYRYSTLVRCGWDCISPSKRNIVKVIYNEGVVPTKKITDLTRLSENAVLIHCENMWLHGILARTEIGNAYYWSIEPYFGETMKKAELV